MAFSSSLRLAVGISALAKLAAAGPCDIYADGDTPCVAAHSTTRALFDGFSGPLYQVSRASDGTTMDIAPVSAGSFANSGAQDTFCDGTTCSITIIYDQTSNANHLTQAPKGAFSGPAAGGADNLADAGAAPVTLDGNKVYGVLVNPGTGYRNDEAVGTATGDGAEGMYAVLDGTNSNDQCCFDYGNAETSNTDTGNGHMEAIYFGTNKDYGSGAGSGPWIMADLENGLSAGPDFDNNPNDPSVTSRFVTAIVKGESAQWALRGGDATTGDLTTYYSGAHPTEDGYSPASKEGAIILGIGGDNSNGGQGTFYEGVMTSGYPSDDTENSVQANIVAAKYSA